MKETSILPPLLVRLALAGTYVSAYSSRINLFGGHPDGWQQFLKYAAAVNSFAPDALKPVLAVTATILEILFSILLIIGYKTKWIAIASGCLTLMFAMAMTYSFGIKEPLDYGVFVNFTAAFLLSTFQPAKGSLDYFISNKK